MIGNRPPIISAKAVMNSAQRVTGRRHSALTSRRIAEISVPAWLRPVQKTKSVMKKPQEIGHLIPVRPNPCHNCDANAPTPASTMATREPTQTAQPSENRSRGRSRSRVRRASAALVALASMEVCHLRNGAEVFEQLAAARRFEQ